MFSGIVEATGRVIAVREEQGNKHFTIEAPFTQELRIDQSIAHNGVCLTVVELEAPHYTVTAIRETLIKSNLGELREGDLVNLERSMRPDALLDGHIVQGHVDQTARCTAITEADGSWYYTFEYDSSAGNITVEKRIGSSQRRQPDRREFAAGTPFRSRSFLTRTSTPISTPSGWERP